jgi:hypothetical protein
VRRHNHSLSAHVQVCQVGNEKYIPLQEVLGDRQGH